jgi:hypothetical protein
MLYGAVNHVQDLVLNRMLGVLTRSGVKEDDDSGTLVSQQHTWWSTLHSLAVSPPVIQSPGLGVSESRLLPGLVVSQGMASRSMLTKMNG